MAWDHKYRPLKAGEIIQPDDQVLNDDTMTWDMVERCIGQPAPDPAYTSHRWYRRLASQAPSPHKEGEDEQQ